jgi:hypothetical protein
MDDTYLYLTYDNSIYTNKDLIAEFYLYEVIKLSIPVIESPNIVSNDFTNIVVFDKDKGIDLFSGYLVVNVDMIPNFTKVLMVYSINNVVSTYICRLTNSYQLVSPEGVDILPKDYNYYDTVTLIRINLPLTNITIDDTKLNKPMTTTYPNLELLKSSLSGGELALFSTLNTFTITRNSIEYSMKIINTDVNNIYLYIYDNNILTSSTTLTATIYNNTNLPNFYDYCSLNSQVSEVNDYMMQKPMIISLPSKPNGMHFS